MTNKLNNIAKSIIPTFGSNHVLKLIAKEDWKQIELKCESSPRSAKIWSVAYGFYDGEQNSHLLPIHFMCSLHPPTSTLESIICAYPEGVNMKESVYKRLPLHIACMENASFNVIKLLLSYNMNGSSAQDTQGRLPLHYALSNAAPIEVITALIQAYPKGVNVTDSSGWLPIHVACYCCSSLEVITMLLGASPQTATLKTDKGRTPMMFVKKCNKRNRQDVVNLLEMASHAAQANRTPRNKEQMAKYAMSA